MNNNKYRFCIVYKMYQDTFNVQLKEFSIL